MPALTADRLLNWEITVPADAVKFTVRAVYPTTDDNLPGWTLFKNHHHKIVFAIYCADRIVTFQPINDQPSEDGAPAMISVGVDFDGVLHAYSRGWQDGTIYDDPVPGAFAAIASLQKNGIAVFVYTSRTPVAEVCDWITAKSNLLTTWLPDESKLPAFWDETTQLLVCNRKLGAAAYIDDRAIRFESWPQALADLAKVVKL